MVIIIGTILLIGGIIVGISIYCKTKQNKGVTNDFTNYLDQNGGSGGFKPDGYDKNGAAIYDSGKVADVVSAWKD